MFVFHFIILNQATLQYISRLNKHYSTKSANADALTAAAGATAAAASSETGAEVNNCRPHLMLDSFSYLFTVERTEVDLRSTIATQKKEPGGALKRAYERPPLGNMVEIVLAEIDDNCQQTHAGC
jgi:hypothetical protein